MLTETLKIPLLKNYGEELEKFQVALNVDQKCDCFCTNNFQLSENAALNSFSCSPLFSHSKKKLLVVGSWNLCEITVLQSFGPTKSEINCVLTNGVVSK